MDVYKDELDTSLIDDYLLSDDIWKQYQIEEMQLNTLPLFDSVSSSLECEKTNQLKYDCMWNGHSKIKSKTIDVKPPVQQQQVQQSLLKPDLRLSVDPNTIVPMMPTFHCSIQTPPISDDEDTKPTHILQSLQSALSENELDDGDLSDYFKDDGNNGWSFFEKDLDDDEDEEEENVQIKEEVMSFFEEDLDYEDDKVKIKQEMLSLEEQHENEMRALYAASDHSYHKGTHHADLRFGNLGIDTPSDSEEEIDVVSLGDKLNVSKSVGALPTNPSTRDRRHIQLTMQSRLPQGVKTIMPVKRAVVSKKSPQSRNCRSKPASRQYKRRFGSGHSSDSEPEPSEKRHLHNNMERQRRIDLRNLFNDLKKLLPEVNKKPRVAKVAILRGAAQYCTDLQRIDENMKRKVENLRQKQAYLRAHLSKLRRDVVAKR